MKNEVSLIRVVTCPNTERNYETPNTYFSIDFHQL
jgi:hypothetical protein